VEMMGVEPMSNQFF